VPSTSVEWILGRSSTSPLRMTVLSTAPLPPPPAPPNAPVRARAPLRWLVVRRWRRCDDRRDHDRRSGAVVGKTPTQQIARAPPPPPRVGRAGLGARTLRRSRPAPPAPRTGGPSASAHARYPMEHRDEEAATADRAAAAQQAAAAAAMAMAMAMRREASDGGVRTAAERLRQMALSAGRRCVRPCRHAGEARGRDGTRCMHLHVHCMCMFMCLRVE